MVSLVKCNCYDIFFVPLYNKFSSPSINMAKSLGSHFVPFDGDIRPYSWLEPNSFPFSGKWTSWKKIEIDKTLLCYLQYFGKQTTITDKTEDIAFYVLLWKSLRQKSRYPSQGFVNNHDKINAISRPDIDWLYFLGFVLLQ